MSKVLPGARALMAITVIMLAVAAPASAAPLTACGNILTDTTWTTANSPVSITCDVIVYPGFTLTIDPGVAVFVTPPASLRIRGVLDAIGTQSSPIVITSASQPSLWGGIAMETNAGGSGTIRFTQVSYAQAGTSVQCCWGVDPPATILDSVYSNNATAISGYSGNKIEIRRTTFSNNTQALNTADKRIYDSSFTGNGCGLCFVERTEVYSSSFLNNGTAVAGTNGTVVLNSLLDGNNVGVDPWFGSGPELHKNTIVNNATGILLPSFGSAAPITYNNIYSNSVHNVRVQGNSNQSLPNNYWGTTNTTLIDAGVHDGYDQAGLGLLVYIPILTQAVTADTTPPDTIITIAPPSPAASSSATLEFTSTELPATFACSLDGGSYSPCSSPKSYTGLADGSHSFSVRATDNDMNTDVSEATTSWIIDTLAPDTTLVSGPSGTGNPSTATFVADSSEPGSTFVCALDDAAFSACGASTSLSGLDDGRHVFQVAAVDAAGNVDPSPAQRVWTVDATAPVVTFLSPNTPGIYVNGTRIAAGGDTPVVVGPLTVTARATDAGSGVAAFAFRVDGQAVPAGNVSYDVNTSTYSFTFTGYGPGPHEIRATATDQVGLQATTAVQVLTIGT